MEQLPFLEASNGIAFLYDLALHSSHTPSGITIPQQNHANLLYVIDSLVEWLPKLNAPIALQKAKALGEVIRNEADLTVSMPDGRPGAYFDRHSSGRYRAFALALKERFSEEMSQKLLFVISERNAQFYSPDAPLFGDQVDRAFPSSASEIAEAGKCRALGRWTACVMHLMRALEPALLSLQAAVGVNVPKEQWNQIIEQIESKIDEIKKRSHGASNEQWFSEAATQFRLIKNAWRNYSQHLHDRYDEERATEIYDSIRAFMRHLATRLSE